MSMNQLWILSLPSSTWSTTRWENDTGDSPGVHDRHFWLAEYTASIFHSSTSTGVPPSDVTASTIANESCLCAICTSVFASDWQPVDVSACTKARMRTPGFFL